MSYFSISLFATSTAHFRRSTGEIPAFYLSPAGDSGGDLTIQFDTGMSPEERLAVAERLATAAAEWRDSLAEQMDRERTTADELAAARAEIARLKGAQIGGAA